MQKLKINFGKETRREIISFYEKSKTEKILVMLLSQDNGVVREIRVIEPTDDKYSIMQENQVSLKPQFLLECIRTASRVNAYAIILMHNHPTSYPLFSRDDRIVNQKWITFFRKNDISIIAGSAVYANQKMVLWTNDKRFCHKWIAIKL